MKSSFIVGRQVSSLQTQALQYVLRYQLKYLPVTYLGVPLYKQNRKACLFDSIISRLRDMLPSWAMANLSHGGRLALIQSVLQATPLHLLQVIHPPKSVLTTIERIFNGFFWGSYNGRRHIHWSSWSKACFLVAEGGLGVRSLADYVRAFSMKLWWRFRSKSSLWSEYLHGHYCRNLHLTIAPYNRNHSPIWYRLCRIRDVAGPFLFWTLGEGSVSFWHDSEASKPAHAQGYLYCGAAGQGDKIAWTGSSAGVFSTKSAWEAIRQASPRRAATGRCSRALRASDSNRYDELVNLIGTEGSVDLITVAQAVHWFDLPRFYSVASHLLRKPTGVVTVWGYGIMNVNPTFDAAVKHWFQSTLPY
ncbi:UNVERIFIED_CONTAM: putative methyltransferase DDB [Sesamum calycinum]|uniref:Methyltransferase DDB n=1 Tax=Sesamum calycinum TaxID=2727403 RepID=A0AAW2JEE1_9LAMI